MTGVDPGIAAVARSLQERVDELATAMCDRIRGEIDFYAAVDAVTAEELHRSVRGNLTTIFEQFTGEGRPGPRAPQRTGRERALQGAPLPEVLHAFRTSFAYLWDTLVAEARASGTVGSDSLVDVAADVWRLMGEYADAVATSYRETAAELMLQREHERSVLVEALLTGVVSDRAALWRTAVTLQLPLEGRFLVVAAEVPAAGREALPGIVPLLETRDVRSAWRLLPDRQIGVLALGSAGTAGDVLALLRREPAARTGVSPVYDALKDTPEALRLARIALDALPAGTPAVAQFEESPIALLAAAAPAEAGRMARAVLGPLLDLPADDRSALLGTLDAWLDCGGSARETGRRLYCHPNTVRYRLRRVEALTGRSPGDPRGLSELSAARDVLRILPQSGGTDR
ncbi:helix-turn-helix domain-containing protein [Streptomyces thermolineatus]|uniref:PucR family transcriptional regulator n=1 Tax=Streptomyces thermolineatus TaxID=44033 RepID=UPI0031DBB15E